MSNNNLLAADAVAAILAAFGDLAAPIENHPAEVMLKPEAVYPACEYLLAEGWEFLADITAVDYPNKEIPEAGVFRLLYQVANYHNGEIVTIKTEIPRESANDRCAKMQSVNGVWRAADWLEREVYDMFGIEFADHPNMKRILLWDGFDGWPLRKDFVHKPTKYQGRRSVD